MFIFSCLKRTSTDRDEWEQSSIVAETTVAELTVALGIFLSLHPALKKISCVCLKLVIVVV